MRNIYNVRWLCVHGRLIHLGEWMFRVSWIYSNTIKFWYSVVMLRYRVFHHVLKLSLTRYLGKLKFTVRQMAMNLYTTPSSSLPYEKISWFGPTVDIQTSSWRQIFFFSTLLFLNSIKYGSTWLKERDRNQRI